MRILRGFAIIGIPFVGIGALLLATLPSSETPLQKADQAYCGEFFKTEMVRAECRKIHGISVDIALRDGVIVRIDDKSSLPTVIRTLKSDYNVMLDAEASGDIADADTTDTFVAAAVAEVVKSKK